LIAIFVLCASLAGAETDPYYAWFHPPRDSTAAINRAINRALDDGLSEVNRAPPASCRDAAASITAPLGRTAAWFFAGSTRAWGVDHSPRNNREYANRFRRESVYRDAPLFPFGSLVPLDPTVRVGDILFGTDKIGHFFTNGLRYYDRYLATGSVSAATETGVAEENGGLGVAVSSVFSYADLQANDRGLAFFRELCEGGGLRRTDSGGWLLARPFDIARFVDPCWDEGYNASSFAGMSEQPIKDAIVAMCPRWRSDRSVVERRRAYARIMAARGLRCIAIEGPPRTSVADLCR
jgi:hypothetical protein